MTRKKGRNDAGQWGNKVYYNPEANRGRVRPIAVIRDPKAIIGPVTGSRPHRRARARMSFEEQKALARSMGFPTPGPNLKVATNEEWIAVWEEAYDRLAKKGIL